MPRRPLPISIKRVRRELRAHKGATQPAARALGISVKTLLAALRRKGLADLPTRLREERRAVLRRETAEALVASGGIMLHAARALGIRESSLISRLGRLGLEEFAAQLRPRPLSAAEERRQIVDAIWRNNGQIGRISAELGISKGTLRARMRKHGLMVEAEARRIEANLQGPRRYLGNKWNSEARRAALIAILKSTGWNVMRASRVAGISVGTMYNRMRDLRIDRRSEIAEEWFHRLVDALRIGNGVLARAGRWLGVGERTVRHWCRELDLEPRDFRR